MTLLTVGVRSLHIGSSSVISRLALSIIFVAVALISSGWCLKQLGNEATWRENEDSAKKAILIVDPTQQVTRDGFVIGWNVYTTRGRRSQSVHLQIWRPVDAANHRYGLVGETVVVALWIGHSYFALYPQDRIAVRRGDVIGIYFPRYNPIPWSAVACRHGNEHLYKYNPYSVTMILSGQRDVVFDTGRKDWNPCRAYSVNASIMDELEMSRYDFDYDETTDGRYELRPYGPHLPRRGRNGGGLTVSALSAALLTTAVVISAAVLDVEKLLNVFM